MRGYASETWRMRRGNGQIKRGMGEQRGKRVGNRDKGKEEKVKERGGRGEAGRGKKELKKVDGMEKEEK